MRCFLGCHAKDNAYFDRLTMSTCSVTMSVGYYSLPEGFMNVSSRGLLLLEIYFKSRLPVPLSNEGRHFLGACPFIFLAIFSHD